jgi:2'-5' RNA ligase
MPRESSIDLNFPELGPLVDRWRLPTVPIASRGVPPHISLLYPWRSAPLAHSDLEAATEAIRGIPPFEMVLRKLDRFPGVLFLLPEPDDTLRALIKRLIVAFPDTPPYGGAFVDPVPHVTLAKASSEDELDRLEQEVIEALAPELPLVIVVREIALDEEGPSGRWVTRCTVPLSVGE